VPSRIALFVAAAVLVIAATACGGGERRPVASTPASGAARSDRLIDQSLTRRRRAAAAGDRAAVAREEATLDQLTARNSGAPRRGASDPFVRMLDAFRFKTGPLYVQQITSSDGSHRLYVSVDKNAFCLRPPAARREAVEAVYLPADRKLRAVGVTDFDFVLIALATTAPSIERALARGRRGRVELIPPPPGC